MKITKKITASLMAVCLSASCMADGLSIIPRPAKLVEGNGQFTFGQVTTAWADAYEGDSIQSLLKSFEQEFTSTTGLAPQSLVERRILLLECQQDQRHHRGRPPRWFLLCLANIEADVANTCRDGWRECGKGNEHDLARCRD